MTTELSGNPHFPRWWDVVPLDTELVIVEGEAYRGSKVTLGSQTYDNAALVYLRKLAGLEHQTHLDIAGTAWAEDAKPYQPKGPTGVAVRTLAELPFTVEAWPR